MFQDLRNRASRAYGQFDKNYAKGLLPGGAALDPKIGGTILAAQEAVPAITRGALGLGDGYDRSINPRMQRGLIEAYETAKARGAPMVKYQDYNLDTAGGYGAKHTFGDVSYSDFKLDEDGKVIGLRPHAYDTNKSVDELTDEINNGGRMYKLAERELARHQDGGIVYHDLDFVESAAAPLRGNLTPMPRMAGEADITVDSTAVPGPATNYAVQAGDTLSSIAADRGTTVAELVKRNNIANPDLIQIGQMLR